MNRLRPASLISLPRLARAKSSVPHILKPHVVPRPLVPKKDDENTTHFRITLMRSCIGLPEVYRKTARSLGFFRRFQVVYHPHSPQIAGKILRLKELVKVENVPTSEVRTPEEQNRERKAVRGYTVVKTGGLGKGLSI